MVGWGDDGRFYEVQVALGDLYILTFYTGGEQFGILNAVPGIRYYSVGMVIRYANKVHSQECLL